MGKEKRSGEGEWTEKREEGESAEGGGGGRERRESLFFGEKWKFNQISFYSANRKSVLIKPKGNAKQPLEMEIVLNRQLFRSGRVWDVYCAQTEQGGGFLAEFQIGGCFGFGVGDKPLPSLAILPAPKPLCLGKEFSQKRGKEEGESGDHRDREDTSSSDGVLARRSPSGQAHPSGLRMASALR